MLPETQFQQRRLLDNLTMHPRRGVPGSVSGAVVPVTGGSSAKWWSMTVEP
ncbi:hypothetical protein DPMN_011307 [Dreissena polymorpha]|uniref:Uncharacterized protein n=1 Tax=Dreissena polymorpha TaxID=45954 RepID=A0A9D4N3S8_DREPO|nr:hypothetical protein DPMN_011307 [Dreissena polymorpha]